MTNLHKPSSGFCTIFVRNSLRAFAWVENEQVHNTNVVAIFKIFYFLVGFDNQIVFKKNRNKKPEFKQKIADDYGLTMRA